MLSSGQKLVESQLASGKRSAHWLTLMSNRESVYSALYMSSFRETAQNRKKKTEKKEAM